MYTLDDIRKGKKLSKKYSLNSDLFIYNGVLYKIFNESRELENKEKVLNTLYKVPVDGCSNIYSLIYDKELRGYGMEYYKSYKTLRSIKKIPFDLKKIYCHKLIEIYNKLKELGYIYYDFHKDNVLVKTYDLKLIDIDSCLNNTRENNMLGMKYLNEMILSILFDTNYFEYQIYYTGYERKVFVDTLYSGLSYEHCENGSLDELDYYIEGLLEKDIKKVKKKLPKRFV